MTKKRRLILVRCVLVALILLNMAVIFFFSAQPGKKSEATSNKISETVLEAVDKEYHDLPEKKQNYRKVRLANPLRKLAHFAEFGSLGALAFLLLLTWRGWIYRRYFASLLFTFVYACTDELHQLITADRGAQFSDVLLDFYGALICCTVLLLIALWRYKKSGMRIEGMRITRYPIHGAPTDRNLRVAVASDIHNCEHDVVVRALEKETPDMILIPGDLMDDRRLRDPDARGYEFLSACAKIAPTYYSFGNHELACYHSGNPWRHPTPRAVDEEIRARIAQTGATLLENDCVRVGELCICGLTTGINGRENHPDAEALARFSNEAGYRILLCHHPEYFIPYIKQTNIELTVCGHAHGGQWRLFGRGVYAPGQGLFPKYTAGVVDGRCVISRGLGTHTVIPRIFNRPELVILEIGK